MNFNILTFFLVCVCVCVCVCLRERWIERMVLLFQTKEHFLQQDIIYFTSSYEEKIVS
jgi:hypothetical protein